MTATTIHNNDEILDTMQSTPRDQAAWAAAVLPDAPKLLPRERGFRLLQTQIKGDEGQRDLMHGLTAKLGDARRDVKAAALNADLTKALQEQRALLVLAETLDDPSSLQARLLPMLRKLPDEHGSLTVATIAAQYLRRGRWDLAHEAYALQVSAYPAHPLSVAAYRWLIRHDSSSEMRRRYELKAGALQKLDFNTGTRLVQADKPEGGKVQQAALRDQPTTRAALQNSLELGKRLGGFGAMYANDPSMLFALQSARRGLGDSAKTTEWYGKFKGYVAQGPWHEAADAEVWLARPGAQPPRKLARCRLTDARPYLDGDLDDGCWQGVKPLLLDNAVGDTAKAYTTQALFAYDQEFFYIALKCRHPKGKQVAPVKVRPRDADVEPFDRVSILLDLDRDYSTCFHLQIDQRGCVREDCCGDLSWNPRWFVAIKSMEDCWQIEAAIPLGELTGQPIALNSTWAFNVVRIVPGQGVQSWSQPADVEPRPEGMSLLQFQQDAERAPAQPMPKAP